MDEYYLQLLGWMRSLSDGDIAVAMLYGIVSGGLVTGGCVLFARARRQGRAEQLRVNPFKYVKLRLGR